MAPPLQGQSKLLPASQRDTELSSLSPQSTQWERSPNPINLTAGINRTCAGVPTHIHILCSVGMRQILWGGCSNFMVGIVSSHWEALGFIYGLEWHLHHLLFVQLGSLYTNCLLAFRDERISLYVVQHCRMSVQSHLNFCLVLIKQKLTLALGDIGQEKLPLTEKNSGSWWAVNCLDRLEWVERGGINEQQETFKEQQTRGYGSPIAQKSVIFVVLVTMVTDVILFYCETMVKKHLFLCSYKVLMSAYSAEQ